MTRTSTRTHRATTRTLLAAAVALVAAATTGPAALAGPGSPGDDGDGGRLSIARSTAVAAPGQTIRLTGLFEVDNPVAGGTVRIYTVRDGRNVPLSGAVVTTDSRGRYAVRVQLSQEGERVLRAIGRKGELTAWSPRTTIRVR